MNETNNPDTDAMMDESKPNVQQDAITNDTVEKNDNSSPADEQNEVAPELADVSTEEPTKNEPEAEVATTEESNAGDPLKKTPLDANDPLQGPMSPMQRYRKPLIIAGACLLALIAASLLYNWLRVPTMEEVDKAFTKKDTAKALQLLAKMSEHGDSAAVYRLYDYYGKNEGEQIHWLRVGADNGIQRAMIDVGLLYFKNHREDSAEYYLMKAAELGNQQGQFQLSNFYHTTNKPDKFKKWAMKAIDGPDREIAGMVCGNMALNYMDEHKNDSALVYALKGSQKGDGNSLLIASHMLRNKGEFDQAIKYGRQAIRDTSGNVKLRADETRFAMSYYDSIGNQKERMNVLIEAAECNIPEMQTLLAIKYYLGDGVEKDRSKAKKWIKQAAKNSDPNAKELLPQMVYSSPSEVSGILWKQVQRPGEAQRYISFSSSGKLLQYIADNGYETSESVYVVDFERSTGLFYIVQMVRCTSGYEHLALKSGDCFTIEQNGSFISVNGPNKYFGGDYSVYK